MALQVEKQRQINLSRVRREAYFEMKTEHFHSFYEFYYLLNGKRKVFVNNRVYHVKEGDMVLIPKGEIHRTTFDSKDGHERIALCFAHESIHHLLEDIGSDTFIKCFEHKHLTIPPNRIMHSLKSRKSWKTKILKRQQFISAIITGKTLL